jgi:hypothetical protein
MRTCLSVRIRATSNGIMKCSRTSISTMAAAGRSIWRMLGDAPGLGIVLDEERLQATRIG